MVTFPIFYFIFLDYWREKKKKIANEQKDGRNQNLV